MNRDASFLSSSTQDRRAGNSHRDTQRTIGLASGPRDRYRLGVPEAGTWRTLLDTDAACYGGSNYGDGATATAEPGPWQELPASLALDLPPLATLILQLDGSYSAA